MSIRFIFIGWVRSMRPTAEGTVPPARVPVTVAMNRKRQVSETESKRASIVRAEPIWNQRRGLD
jgi:hypothetical protein